MLLRQGRVLEHDSIISNPFVVFLHIEKTAGVSFRRFLFDNYGDNNVVDILYMDTRKIARPNFHNKKAMCGHYHVNSYVYDIVPSPFVHFTILRDPVERVVSAYHFFREHPEHILLNRLANQFTLEEIFERRRDDFHCVFNWMCYFLSGVGSNISPALFEISKYTLIHDMTFFGFVEHLEELMRVGQNLLGWSTVGLSWMNRTENKEKPSDYLISLIKQHNKYDVLLYEFAKDYYCDNIQRWLR